MRVYTDEEIQDIKEVLKSHPQCRQLFEKALKHKEKLFRSRDRKKISEEEINELKLILN